MEDSSPDVEPPDLTSMFEGDERNKIVDSEDDGEKPVKRPRLLDSPGSVIRNKLGWDNRNALVDAKTKVAVQSTESTATTTVGDVGGEESTNEAYKAQLAAEGEQKFDAKVDGAEGREAEIPLESAEKTAEQGGDVSEQHHLDSVTKGISWRIEIPVSKVEDLIQNLQLNFGSSIEIIRGADADPWSTTRPIELVGTLESLLKADRLIKGLIKDVIAEDEVGGSLSLVAGGFASAIEIEIVIPDDRVGLLDCKMIRNLQTRSGACIEMIPQNIHGDQFKEKKVKVTGDLRQVNMARELIKEVVNQVGGVKECTSESYDFLNQPFDFDRGDEFMNAIVAVVDSCRQMDVCCNRDELTFLSNPSGLVDYQVSTDLCEDCLRDVGSRIQHRSLGISEHGFFCAAIIASRRITEARLEEVSLGPIRGVCPPPRIALYGVGCRSCLRLSGDHMMLGVRAATAKKVDIISMSLAFELPAKLQEQVELQCIDETLEAFKNDILTVVGAGNMGQHRLGSIAMSAPWCLTVGSCSSKRKFKTIVEFGCEAPESFESIEGSSINLLPTSHWSKLRQIGQIRDRLSVMYLSGDGSAEIKGTSYFDYAPSVMPIVKFTKEQSTTVSKYLDTANSHGVDLCVHINSSSKVEIVDSPLVSGFSSRGPCSYYGDFMKPDIVAPGEQIAAAFPPDVAIGRSDPPYYADYNVQSGTSFAAPQVAAAAALLRAEMKFSASAISSALITTAKKMHGKELIAYEYAYGAGMVDLRRAMRPGLVYEEQAQRYMDYVDGILAHYELNLPYFSASFPASNEPWQCEFKRKVKNVELGRCTYKIDVDIRATTFDMRCSEIHISSTPTSLVFEEYVSEREFTVSIALPHSRVPVGSFGLLSGSVKLIEEENDELLVESPIIISSKYIPPFHIIDKVYNKIYPT